MNLINNKLISNARKLAKSVALVGAASSALVAGVTQAGNGFEAMLDSNSEVSVFAHALDQSGLLQDIDSAATLTLFVPGNAAMDADGSRFLLESVLVADGNEQRLRDAISYHIVAGSVELDSQVVPTLDGSCLDIAAPVDGDKRGVAERITKTAEFGNVTIHFVDGLLEQDWNDDRVCGVRS